MSRKLFSAIGLFLLVAGEIAALFWAYHVKGLAQPATTGVLAGYVDAGLITLETEEQKKVADEIDRTFADLQDERFHLRGNIVIASGSMMTLPSGHGIPRSILREEAEPIIAHGKVAVPYLYKWVMSDTLMLQHVAVYSLEQITGISFSSAMSRTDQEDGASGREAAIKTWKAWLAASP